MPIRGDDLIAWGFQPGPVFKDALARAAELEAEDPDSLLDDAGGDGVERARVRLGREHTVVARCSWCTMPIVEAEVDPLTGKPFMQNGRPYHQECHAYRR